MFGIGKSKDKKPAKAAPLKSRSGSSAHAGAPHHAARREEVPSEGDPQATTVLESSQPKLIRQLSELPASQGLLTVGPKAIFKMPRNLETSLVAVELGPRRAAILYDPDPAKKDAIAPQLKSLRAAFASQSYTVERTPYPVLPAILKSLVENSVSRHGSEGNEGMATASKSKSLFMSWLNHGVREGATDIHCETKGDTVLVYLRVDGELERMKDDQGGYYTRLVGENAMAYPFNSMTTRGTNSAANWSSDQNLYCMTEALPIGNKQISLRYQSLRGYSGAKVICRILNTDPNAPTLTYDQLGYSADQRQIMLDVANIPSGFVLFAGVTGSGKTTSLKTFIETHPGNGTSAFYSIEDPVEYPLKGVHQIVIQRDVSDKDGSKKAYQETVTSLMRADPDAVSIGEIRDEAGAGAGQSIVETGHMALGTVHAHLITGIIPRLTNEEVGMSRDVLTNPNMLSLLAYQALVPKLCQHCRLDSKGIIEDLRRRSKLEGADANAEHHVDEILTATEKRFKLNPELMCFRNLEGCEKCSNRGTKGLTVVAEMLIPDRTWLTLTRNLQDYEASVHFRASGDGKYDSPFMAGKTVFEHTLYKAQAGLVDPRNCERFDSFKRFELFKELGNNKDLRS